MRIHLVLGARWSLGPKSNGERGAWGEIVICELVDRKRQGETRTKCQRHGRSKRNVHLLQPRPLIIIALIHAHTRLSIPRASRKREEFLELVNAREDDRVPERQQHKFAHVQARLTTTWRSVGRVAVPRASMRLARFAEGEEEWVCLEGEEYLDTKIEGTAFVCQL